MLKVIANLFLDSKSWLYMVWGTDATAVIQFYTDEKSYPTD